MNDWRKGCHRMPTLLLLLALLLTGMAQASIMADVGVSRVSEDCGKWRIGFNWSELDDYSKSISHSDSESGKVKISTDTLIMTSSSDRKQVVKVSIAKYSAVNTELANGTYMMTLANETLKKSGVCKDINAFMRQIDGRPGAFAGGAKCPLGEPVWAAVYPVDYHLDRPGGVLAASALGIILSTYEQEVTSRLIDSVKIQQTG